MADSTYHYRPTILPPTLLGLPGSAAKNTPAFSDVANDLATKALYAKDMWGTAQLMAQIARGSATPGPLAIVNAAFFVNSIMPDVLKPPYTYYSGGFERPTPLTYGYLAFAVLFRANLNHWTEYLSNLNLTSDSFKLVHAPEKQALTEALDKTFGALEQGIASAEGKDSWVEFALTSGELVKKISDAVKAVIELGDSVVGEEKGTGAQQKSDLPHTDEPDYPKYDGMDFNGDGVGSSSVDVPSPSEDSEFDG
ncbi:hypothetical protein [Rhizobium sp. CNPSo 3490]|uniref:hypothetical protein n=1 Tax=Rhizobium sp. CNPSo 3490 TaxID=3021407 RepID=UPI00254C78DA|nr:hypothetical protein [Rhizobium sp. CNPSo 3490]MDK4733532.1 hypothetical protein [Rhizobium sp. CNPSo 3490]